MSGYRDRSDYDPYLSPPYGRPLRPYNRVQWGGIALMLVSSTIYFLYFAGKVGWIRPLLGSPMFGLPPLIFGSMLVNSRRVELADPAPELAEARRRWMLIIVIGCIIIFAGALIIDTVR